MILILSISSDTSTDNVSDYLDQMGAKYIRLHPEDFDHITFFPGENYVNFSATSANKQDKQLFLDQIKIVWFRKWATPNFGITDPSSLERSNEEALVQCLKSERSSIINYITHSLTHVTWMNHPSTSRISKPEQLTQAKLAGLTTPSTIITSSKSMLIEFYHSHDQIISKSIDAPLLLHDPNSSIAYLSYTNTVTESDIDALPLKFFPSMFQEYIDKDVEIRVFYLGGQIWSMAIFSQNDDQTAVDFRKYNKAMPNRTTCFQMPNQIKNNITRFMERTGLITGSLDFILTPSGEYVFLEVNPSGQYDMISKPCNYHLDKAIATFLYNSDKDEKLTFHKRQFAVEEN